MFQRQFWCCVVAFAFALMAHAQTYYEFKTVDGRVISGRPVSAKESFVQVAIEGGGYTNLYWGRLSQDTLRQLATKKGIDKTVAAYAQVFIDPPKSTPDLGKGKGEKKVVLKPVPRMDRPDGGSLMASPVMVFLFLLLYGANIYAAYEIAIFRQQPPALVCVIAAIAPIIGPAIFLAMPTRQAPEEQPVLPAEPEAVVEEAPVVVEEAPAPVTAEQPAIPQPVVYARGQFTFNRRFFETKFAGFLKMVPGEAERDKVVFIKSARGEYTGQRFSKIEPNEVYLQVRKGNVSEDVMLPYGEIYEVVIKHKDT